MDSSTTKSTQFLYNQNTLVGLIHSKTHIMDPTTNTYYVKVVQILIVFALKAPFNNSPPLPL
jgi:type III secretory pathway component EscS